MIKIKICLLSFMRKQMESNIYSILHFQKTWFHDFRHNFVDSGYLWTSGAWHERIAQASLLNLNLAVCRYNNGHWYSALSIWYSNTLYNTVRGTFASLLMQFTINVECDTGAPVTYIGLINQAISSQISSTVCSFLLGPVREPHRPHHTCLRVWDPL